MMNLLKLNSPAQLGNQTIFDKSYTPWKILTLHVIFDLWCDDDILKTSPCFYVTRRLREALLNSELSGYSLGEKVQTEVSLTYRNLYPKQCIADYYLLNITGKPNQDDFSLLHPNSLILSSESMSFLTNFKIGETSVIVDSGNQC